MVMLCLSTSHDSDFSPTGPLMIQTLSLPMVAPPMMVTESPEEHQWLVHSVEVSTEALFDLRILTRKILMTC